MNNMIKTFKAARRVSTPLIAINTPDPASTVQGIVSELPDDTPVLSWDVVQGLGGVNDLGVEAFVELGADNSAFIGNEGIVEVLMAAKELPKGVVVFFVNAHRFLSDINVSQALWNLRDDFKEEGRTAVILAPMFNLPIELERDVLTLDEPLPGREELAKVVVEQFENGDLDVPDSTVVDRCVDALEGLAYFPAEQAAAMSLTKDGMDFEMLWGLKRTMIEQTKGLTVMNEKITFEDIGGLDNLKEFAKGLLYGKNPPRAIVFIDEIEKAMSGSTGGDLSGVSSDQLQELLKYQNDYKVPGMMLVGVPGSGKSMIAKAMGSVAGIPTIAFDLGAMKGSLVGESEERIRSALKVVTAVSGGKPMFIATSNNIAQLPPELKRRYKVGTFFFDLPGEDERDLVWFIYMEKYEHGTLMSSRPDDEGWTPAEIETCCELAWRLDITLKEAATYIVPIKDSAENVIERLRTEASGRYISASKKGTYTIDTTGMKRSERTRRKVEVA